jgi:hypothetical protein
VHEALSYKCTRPSATSSSEREDTGDTKHKAQQTRGKLNINGKAPQKFKINQHEQAEED